MVNSFSSLKINGNEICRQVTSSTERAQVIANTCQGTPDEEWILFQLSSSVMINFSPCNFLSGDEIDFHLQTEAISMNSLM